MEEYAVEIMDEDRSGYILLFQQNEGVLRAIGRIACEFPVDREIALFFRQVIVQDQPFMKAEGREFYWISKDLGEALKLHMKIFAILPSFQEKLLYIDRTQIFSLIESKQYKQLVDRLNVFYLSKKLEFTGIKEA